MRYRILTTPGGALGGMIVLIVVFVAALSGLITPYDPNKIDVLNRFATPSLDHWLGTDQVGRDLLSRMLRGASVAIGVASSSITLALIVGCVLGLVAGNLPTNWECPFIVLFDVLGAFPAVLIALAVLALFGPSNELLIVVVAVTLTPHFGRVTRAQMLSLRSAPFMEAERILGASFIRILFYHVAPNIAGPVVVLACMEVPSVIAMEAGLAFIGLGVRPPRASWGTLLNDGYVYLNESPTTLVAVLAAIGIATLGFTLLGEAVGDVLDPRSVRGNSWQTN